jgi:hypothetical protein
VDRAGEFRSIREINNEIRRLNLAAYAPLRYVLPHKQAAYDKKYSTEIRGGEGFFRQVDREESLIHLLRVNVLKRMESACRRSPHRQRQLADVEATLARIETHVERWKRSTSRTWTSTTRLREPARRAQGQGAAEGRGPGPLEAGPDRGPQPPGDAALRAGRAGGCPRDAKLAPCAR